MTEQEAWEYVIAKELDVQYLDMPHRVKVSNRSEGSSAFGFFEGIGDDIIDAVQDFRRMVMAERVDRFQALMTDRIRGLEAVHSLPQPGNRKCEGGNIMTEQEALERIKQADLDVWYSSGYPYREYRHWQVEEALSAETLVEAVQNYVLFLEERIERDWRVLGILAPTIDERSKPYPQA